MQQECIPVGCLPRLLTVCRSILPECRLPWMQTFRQMQTPQEADPLRCRPPRGRPPGGRPPTRRTPWRQTPLVMWPVSGGSRIFPRGGREPSSGGVNTPNFPENCMKSKEFGRPGGGVRPSRPPRSANACVHAGKPIPPSLLWTEWQMLVKILPCPKTSFAGGNSNNLTFHLYSHNLKLYWLDLRDYRCCKYTKNLLNSLLTTNHLYFILGIATCIFHSFVNSLCSDMCVRGSWFDSHYLVLGTYLKDDTFVQHTFTYQLRMRLRSFAAAYFDLFKERN